MRHLLKRQVLYWHLNNQIFGFIKSCLGRRHFMRLFDRILDNLCRERLGLS